MCIYMCVCVCIHFPGGTSGKESAFNAGDIRRLGFDPWVAKIPWGEHGNPLQYSCLENTMDRGAWQAIVHRVTKSRTWLKWLSSSTYQFSSVTQSCPTLCDPMDWGTPGFPVHQLPEFTQTHVHWVADAIQPSHSLLSPSPPTFNLSQHQGLFQWVNSSHQEAKVLEFQFNISPSTEYSGLIRLRMDGLDLLTVQGTLKSLLQHHSSKASILRCLAFFIVHFSHP